MRLKGLERYYGISGISIHAPLTGCDPFLCFKKKQKQYFNPRTPYGMRRLVQQIIKRWNKYFNPRTPYGMRLIKCEIYRDSMQFQSTHPLRDATGQLTNEDNPNNISIHAPLTGCDYGYIKRLNVSKNFNPRTPYGMRL